LRTAEPTDRTARADYALRVNRAVDHVVGHLDGPLRLDAVAAEAGFSPFHFHRVFQAVVGETLGRFVKRVRLERALHLLAHGRRRPLTEIALACGFASSSDFSRCFKQRYGVAPSAFDLTQWRARRAADLADAAAAWGGRPRLGQAPRGKPDEFAVRVRDLPARTVAYLRVLRPYEGGVVEAVARLVAWAEARGKADGQWLGYQWENPEIVALEDCRYDVAVEVDDVEPEGEVGRFDFPAMTVAEIEMLGGVDLELRALEWLYGTWLPSSVYEPDDHPGFEAWIGRPFAHGMERFALRIQVPVRRRRAEPGRAHRSVAIGDRSRRRRDPDAREASRPRDRSRSARSR
jgi:AraC family transcriptional regulator